MNTGKQGTKSVLLQPKEVSSKTTNIERFRIKGSLISGAKFEEGWKAVIGKYVVSKKTYKYKWQMWLYIQMRPWELIEGLIIVMSNEIKK